MRRSENYVLRELNGVPYLLPYGQAQAEFARGSRLNETGAFLWNLLEKERNIDELIAACAEYYGVAGDGLTSLTSDIQQFLQSLSAHGFLTEDRDRLPSENTVSKDNKYIKAGSLTIKLAGPPIAFSEHFDAFVCEAANTVDQTVTIHPFSPLRHINGEILLRNGDLTVIDSRDQYVLLFPSMGRIEEAHLSKDGSTVDFYCHPPYTDDLREELFHAIRLPFLYLTQRHRMAVLHSASFLYRDRAWLFSGPSGTGKSTHTNLWKELFQVPILNGDLNLLAIENGHPVIHGLPWCGTSGICDPGTYPLGGIILLRQAGEDYLEELSADRKRLLVLQRLISPTWIPEMLSANLNLVDELADKIYIARLHCTKNFSAVEVMKERIDAYLISH